MGGRRLRIAAFSTAMLLSTAACGGAAAAPSGSPAASALPAGTYSSQAFSPPFSYTIPSGWANAVDTADYWELRPAGSDIVGIYLFSGAEPASQDSSCPDSAEPGVGTSSTQLATWIRGLKGLKVAAPRLATVGGLRGSELDIQIADGWTFSCSFASGLPTVPLLMGANGSFRWVIAGNERLRLDLLDGPAGSTVIVDIDAFEGSLFDDLLAAATPIVRTISFSSNSQASDTPGPS